MTHSLADMGSRVPQDLTGNACSGTWVETQNWPVTAPSIASQCQAARGYIFDMTNRSSYFLGLLAASAIAGGGSFLFASGGDSGGQESRQARCAVIEVELGRIDESSRSGASAGDRDSLRARRQELADEKHELKC